MKKSIALLLGCISIICTGCVSTTYTKSVTVTKDPSGKIVQIVEYEGVTQPNQNGWPVQYEYLKGVRLNESK